MRKRIITATCCLMLIASGCGIDTHNNHQSQGLNRMQDPTQEVTYKGPSKNIQQHSNFDAARGSFGHTHYTRKPGRAYALDPKHIPKVDYQALSDIITRLELTLPEIYDVGTLVTDEYVLIGYKTSNDNRNEAAQQVKRTAISVVPNYYKIYISDQPYAQTEIANFKDLTVSTPRVHQWLDHLINRMKEAPQGTPAPKASDNSR